MADDPVDASAEESRGFALPPLPRAAYTRVGNGGLCLNPLGLAGGRPAVICEPVERFRNVVGS